jgi:hypothetical protein
MRLPVVAMLVTCVATAVAACSVTTQPSGFDVCGTHLNTGANIPAKTTLPAPRPEQLRPAPAKSVLPGPVASPTPNVVYLATADCDTGALVTVDPATAAGLVGAAYARDGGVAALVLTTSEKVTVRAWRGGVMTGIITLPAA